MSVETAARRPYPAAFHVGPGHLIVHGNAAFIDVFGRACVGQPAREALLDLPTAAFELMDLVYRSGKPLACRIDTRRRRAPPGRRGTSGSRDRRDLRGNDAPQAADGRAPLSR